jgi:hypothetical protein
MIAQNLKLRSALERGQAVFYLRTCYRILRLRKPCFPPRSDLWGEIISNVTSSEAYQNSCVWQYQNDLTATLGIARKFRQSSLFREVLSRPVQKIS